MKPTIEAFLIGPKSLNLFEGFPFWNTSEAGEGNPVRQGGEMSAAQIAFDMEVGEAFEYRENEYRETRKALAVKAVEERARQTPRLSSATT